MTDPVNVSGRPARERARRAWLARAFASLPVLSALIVLPAPAGATTISRSIFGTLPDGRPVAAVTLRSRTGLTATIIAYGATLQSVVMQAKDRSRTEVTLGHASLEPYLSNPQYFGSTVGRFANRIAAGRFAIDGRTFQVPRNNGPNALHGGMVGFDKVLWDVAKITEGRERASVTLRYVSPDGDQGFPGELTATATYSLDERDRLRIEYRATTDRPTVVNLTNHTYWNLAGDGSPRGAMGHILTIPAASYLPVDATLIPTGERRSVAGTVFDFRRPHVVADRVREAADQQIGFGRGYDHNWIVGAAVTSDLHLTSRLSDPVSGRGFELWSNQPGVQFYSGNFLDGTITGRTGRLYRQGDAIALEPQLFPDGVNRPEFPSPRLDPGREYSNVIEYRFFRK